MEIKVDKKFKAAIHVVWNLLLIATGSFLGAAAVNSILIPMEFFGAGFTGITLLVHYLIPWAPLSVIFFILNIPVYILGYLFVSRRFFLYSIPGMIFFSIALIFVKFQIPLNDKILAAILGGIIMGAGTGITLRSHGSGGGLDILSVMFLRLFSMRLGTTILLFNVAVLAAAAILFPIERALYTLIFIFISSNITNLVVTGLSQRKTVLIISSRWEEISKVIMDTIHRGVTILSGRGAYTNKEENILYTIISFNELPPLKKIVRDIDPDAILVVNDTLEVMGYRIGNQPHW
jgi:uncharacterized membrane-anchored protein YitT (DUF2179 family)